MFTVDFRASTSYFKHLRLKLNTRIEIMSLRFKLIRNTNEAIKIFDDMDSDFESDTETSESDEEGSADEESDNTASTGNEMNGTTESESESENEIDTLPIQFVAEVSIPLVSVDVPSSTSTQVPSTSSAGNHTSAEMSETDDSETDYVAVRKRQKTTTTRKSDSRKTSYNSMTNHTSNNKAGLTRKKGTTTTKKPKKNISKSTYTWTQTTYEHDHTDFAVRPGPTFRRQSLPNNE